MYFIKVKVLDWRQNWVDCLINVNHIVGIKPDGENFTTIFLDQPIITSKTADCVKIPTPYEEAEKMILEALKRI